jgi:hypothetical protein
MEKRGLKKLHKEHKDIKSEPQREKIWNHEINSDKHR